MRAKKPWNHPETVARFWARVEKDPGSDCLLFKGALDRGWGRLKAWGLLGCEGGLVWAHRYAYALEHGAPEAGADIHHDHDICRHRNCVNTDHLGPIDHGEHGAVSRAHQSDPGTDAWEPTGEYLEPMV